MKNINRKVKFGLLCFNSENIGDEIQSLAAQRFLPRIDYYINRDNIDSAQIPNNESVKIILNSWFMSPYAKDKKYHWPPSNPSLDPLLISMHVSFYNQSQQAFSTRQSCSFLKKHSPVGARDLSTLKYFKSINIPSYFSGCLTLTLLPDPKIKKQDFVLAVDVDDDVYHELQKRTSRKIIRINTVHETDLDLETRFNLAKYWLYLYQSAHCVVTHRLHAMLPCLGLNTPVIGITGRDKERFSGLIDLVNNYSKFEFIKNKKISIDKPKTNPATFESLRDELIKKCSDYTGYDSRKSFMYGSTVQELLSELSLSPAFLNGVENSFNLSSAKRESLSSEEEIKGLKQQINTLTIELDNIKNQYADACRPGVKMSFKNLLKAFNRYFKKKLHK